MIQPPSVAVLVSAGCHPETGTPRACRGDVVAFALARNLAGDTLRVVHAGHADDEALQHYLALGARRIEVLPVAEDQDVVPPLAVQLRDCDVIITGSRAERGIGSGLLPYLLAEALGRPVVTGALGIETADDGLNVHQFLPKGRRRAVSVPIPCVVASHPLAPVEIAYAYSLRMSGRIVPTELVPLAESNAQSSAWTFEPSGRRPVQLKAQSNLDGNARMLSFVQSQAKGGTVAFDGSPVDKAQILLTYLREHRLIDF